MPLQKQPASISFGQGLDTKTDPWQVSPGKWLLLNNTVFNKAGLLEKRNGMGKLTALPTGADAMSLTTFQGNLAAIGSSLYAYNRTTQQWSSQGNLKLVNLSVQSTVRTAYSQTAPDAAVSSDGIVCTAFHDGDGSYKYQVSDNTTGQSLTGITTLPSGAYGARVFALPRYFIITFTITVSATPRLQYIAVPIGTPQSPLAAVDLSTQVKTDTSAYDGFVANNTLYLAWDGSDVSGALRVSALSSTLTQQATQAFAGFVSNLISVTADVSSNSPVIWITSWRSSSGDASVFALSTGFSAIQSGVLITNGTFTALTGSATGSVYTLITQSTNTYSFSSTRSDYLTYYKLSLTGVAGATGIFCRSVGLASKSFLIGSSMYMLASYAGTYQPTYFLIDLSGNVIGKLAYENGGGYVTTHVLPNVSVYGNVAQMAYLLKNLIQAVNKTQGVANTNGIYSQTGVDIASFDFAPTNTTTAEIGGNLHLSGAILWAYDGVKPREQGFHLYPEDITATTSTTGGVMAAQTYFYQVVYEWTDGQGNIHRSAPSVPVTAVTTGATSSVTLKIPTLRLTYKTSPNAARIVVYRWSTAQQTYYQVSSVSSPTLNSTTTDSVTYVDTLADSAILGNNIIYTNGGVIENIGAPACSAIALYGSRLFLIYAEDNNLLGFSKQVIEATPVEMSDLFTLYTAPTTGSQGSTGDNQCLVPMDDKLIVSKPNAFYYIVGNGPNNLGLDNDFSNPVFINSTVGCSNPKSIVFTPKGIMFDSDKGRWLLGRDLSTIYVGAPVEQYNSLEATSALNIPGTNQVRIGLSDNTTLMYDYYYEQWGTFSGFSAVSATLYNNLHTVLGSDGNVYQETEGAYVDGASPVLISLKSSWYNLAGLQGYQRAYYFYLLGQYISPHKLSIAIAYDYNASPSQSALTSPANYQSAYGDANYYGQGQYGSDVVEEARVFFKQQKCTAFQISITEVFDSSYSTAPGAGLTLSGLNFVVGLKKGYKPTSAAKSIG